MSEPEPIDDELLQMAQHPKLAQSVKESLHRLANGSAGPALAEMARELLAGRTSLREIGQSQAYAEELSAGVARFQQWQRELTTEQRAELERQTQATFNVDGQTGDE